MIATSTFETGPFIARGLTAEVFEFGPDRVVKLYLPWMKREKAEWELSATRALHAIGLPVPNAFEIVEVDGRLGLVMERLRGESMLRRNMRRPWNLFAAAREMAEIHAQLHSISAPAGLPTQHYRIERWLSAARDLSSEDCAAAKEALAEIPDGNAICHGDFHPENIFYSAGRTMIIDWSGATRGHALGDVARTASLLRRAEIPADWPLYLRTLVAVSRKILLKVYLQRYFELRGGSETDLAVWEPIQKAAMSAWRAREENYV